MCKQARHFYVAALHVLMEDWALHRLLRPTCNSGIHSVSWLTAKHASAP